MSITNASKKEKPQESFQLINTSNISKTEEEAFKVFEWLSMTFLAAFLTTKTLVMENYCPKWKHLLVQEALYIESFLYDL